MRPEDPTRRWSLRQGLDLPSPGMPAWATVVISLGAAAVAVLGTLAGIMLQLRESRRQRKADEIVARRARAANVIGRVRTLIADLEPTRVGINATEETPAKLRAVEERWNSLRDELSIFAAGEEADVMDAAAKLEVSVSNLHNRVSWYIHDLRGRLPHREMYGQAKEEYLIATTRVRIVLDLVRGRDISELEATLRALADGATPGQPEAPKPAEEGGQADDTDIAP